MPVTLMILLTSPSTQNAQLQPSTPQPVMVYIYGGVFQMGSGDERLYGFDYFLRHNVVCVSFNYRLGALGFLSLADPAVGVPGNAGLKDQTMALQWVRQNIDRFGGDAASVTVFGNSAGGSSVQYHMLSNYSRGLFDRAILQSGADLNTQLPYDNVAANCPFRLAHQLGFTGNESDASGTVAFLRAANATLIVQQQSNITGCHIFSPNTEPYDDGEQTFLPASVDAMAASGPVWSRDMPLVIGGTTDEGYNFYAWLSVFLQKATVRGAAAFCLPPAVLLQKGAPAVQRVMDYYGVSDGMNATSALMAVMRMFGDRFYWLEMHATIVERLRSGGKGNTYVYHFAKDSRRMEEQKNLIMHTTKDVRGVCHAEEARYMFKAEIFRSARAHSSEERLIERMTSMWTRFAATGEPLEEWQAVKAADGPYFRAMRIDDVCKMQVLPMSRRAVFWYDVMSAK